MHLLLLRQDQASCVFVGSHLAARASKKRLLVRGGWARGVILCAGLSPVVLVFEFVGGVPHGVVPITCN